MPSSSPSLFLYLNPFSQDHRFPPGCDEQLEWRVWVSEHAPSVFSSGCPGLKNLVGLDGELAERSSINFPLLLCKKMM